MNGIRGIKLSLQYLVRIEYKDPKAVVYKNMSAAEYPHFQKEYPEKAIAMGLGEPQISIEKEFIEQLKKPDKLWKENTECPNCGAKANQVNMANIFTSIRNSPLNKINIKKRKK